MLKYAQSLEAFLEDKDSKAFSLKAKGKPARPMVVSKGIDLSTIKEPHNRKAVQDMLDFIEEKESLIDPSSKNFSVKKPKKPRPHSKEDNPFA